MRDPLDARTSPSRTDQTRDALMTAGTELFAEQGFDGATVEEISRRAGINKALINYHFGGKEGLYHAILLDHFEETSRSVQAIQGNDGSAADRLSSVVELMLQRVERRPTLPAMLLRETISGGAHLEESVLRFMGGMAGSVQKIIAHGVATGEFRAVDPHQAYLSLIGGLIFFFGTRKFRDRVHDGKLVDSAVPTAREFADHTIEFTLRALAPLPDDTLEGR